MKTLNYLWEWAGCKPFKVRMGHWPAYHWFMVMGQSPIGSREFYGYFDNGFVIGYAPHVQEWILLNESGQPEPVPATPPEKPKDQPKKAFQRAPEMQQWFDKNEISRENQHGRK